MFLANQRFTFIMFFSVAPHRGQPAAKCHPRWQPTRRLAVSCGLGRRRIRTRDCRTTVWHTTIEPPRLRGVVALGRRGGSWEAWFRFWDKVVEKLMLLCLYSWGQGQLGMHIQCMNSSDWYWYRLVPLQEPQFFNSAGPPAFVTFH